MKIKLLPSSASIRSILAWLIKLATMGFNLPATMGVIGTLVQDVTDINSSESALKPINAVVLGVTIDSNQLLLYLLVISGIVVLDTVFLASWYELDTNKTQDDSDKLADAITVVVMYMLTIGVGLLHGEGLVGLLFRIPMGIAVARSTWKTISFSMRRTGDDTKGKNMPLRVRLAQMKALATKGIALVQYEVDTFIEDLKARRDVEKAHRDQKTLAGVNAASVVAPIYDEQAALEAKAGLVGLLLGNNSQYSIPATTTTVATQLTTNSSSVKSNDSKKYTIEEIEGEWVAVCLHPGCGEVCKAETKDSVRRKIVGHGNKHRGSSVIPEVVEPINYIDAEIVVDPNPEVIAEAPADGFR